MDIAVTPTEFAQEIGISRSYSSQILNGSRPCPQAVALKAYRVFGIRLGLIADLDADDIAKLCEQERQAAAPLGDLGGDACASVGDAGAGAGDDVSGHGAVDSEALTGAATGQMGDLSRDQQAQGIVA